MSHDKNDEIQDTTACSATCSFAEKKSESRLIKQQVFSSYWTYLISGAWGLKSWIAVFFALTIETWNTLFFGFSSPNTFGWYNCL